MSSDGTEANSSSTSSFGFYYPAISADGRHVTFASYASNLIPALPYTTQTLVLRRMSGRDATPDS